MPALDREQQALALQAAGVAAQAAGAGEHAVARDDDRDRVGAQRAAGGAKGGRRAGGDRHVLVRARGAERDPRALLQHAAAKALARQRPVQRQVEVLAAPVEVLVELAADAGPAGRAPRRSPATGAARRRRGSRPARRSRARRPAGRGRAASRTATSRPTGLSTVRVGDLGDALLGGAGGGAGGERGGLAGAQVRRWQRHRQAPCVGSSGRRRRRGARPPRCSRARSRSRRGSGRRRSAG